MYLNDLFMFLEETKICNCVDETTIYACGPEIKTVLNFKKLNKDKCQLMISGAKRDTEIILKTGEVCTRESKGHSLLGTTPDQSFSFKAHVKTLCRKASQRQHAVARISCYMDTEKLKKLMKALLLSQFNYCLIVWMLCDRALNRKVNHVHERAL